MTIYDGDPRRLVRWREAGAPPSHAVWEITLRCDLGCAHCGSRAGRARPDELSTDAALRIVDELAAAGIREVTLIGGEFYLREDWDEIAAAIVEAGMMCSLVSGARQLTPARIARAAAAGIGKISLSLDGLPATHDAIRGSAGSFAAAIAAGRAIADAGIDLSVNTQINRLTLPELTAFAARLPSIGVRSWMVILTAAMGRGADRPGLMLQPYHLLDLFPRLAAIKRDILDPAGIALFPANNLGYFGPLAESLRYGAARGHAWTGCDAGRGTIGIEADGRLKGCPSLPTEPYAVGRLGERPLAALLDEAFAERPIASTEELWGFCASCAYRDRCRAGCTWTTHVLFGRRGNNPFCHHRALALAAEGRAETLERAGAAPGRPFDFGAWQIVERPLAEVRDGDKVLDRCLGADVFGLAPDAASAWTPTERAAALAVSS